MFAVGLFFVCVCLQALAEQQKAQQLAQQQAGAPQTQAAAGQAQTPVVGQAQVPQAAGVTGATAVPNAAVLVRNMFCQHYSTNYPSPSQSLTLLCFPFFRPGRLKTPLWAPPFRPVC